MFAQIIRLLTGSEVAPPANPRERLRKALAERAASGQALQVRNADVQRVVDVIEAVEPAEKSAQVAAKEASEATRRWAEAGARADVPSGDQALLNRAAELQRAAQQARLKADGAEAGLPAVASAERDAQIAVNRADDAIREARADVMLADVDALLIDVEPACNRIAEALELIAALREIQNPRWGPAHTWGKFRNTRAFAALEQRMHAVAVPVPDGRQLEALSQRWAEYAARLTRDPDARFIGE